MRKFWKIILIVPILFYIIFFVTMYKIQEQYMFHPSHTWRPPPVDMNIEEVYIDSDDNIKLHAWFLKNTDAVAAVTRAIEKVEFREPVYSGEWVNFTSVVIKTGKSSVTINVEAFAESKSRGKRLACTAIITMVSVIKKGDAFVKFHHGNQLD